MAKKKITDTFETTDLYYSLKILYVGPNGKETSVWSHACQEDKFAEDEKYIQHFKGKGYLIEKRIGSDVEKEPFE